MFADDDSDSNPLGSVTTYIYDPMGRITEVIDPPGTVTSVIYEFGRLVRGPNPRPCRNPPLGDTPPDEPHIVE